MVAKTTVKSPELLLKPTSCGGVWCGPDCPGIEKESIWRDMAHERWVCQLTLKRYVEVDQKLPLRVCVSTHPPKNRVYAQVVEINDEGEKFPTQFVLKIDDQVGEFGFYYNLSYFVRDYDFIWIEQ